MPLLKIFEGREQRRARVRPQHRAHAANRAERPHQIVQNVPTRLLDKDPLLREEEAERAAGVPARLGVPLGGDREEARLDRSEEAREHALLLRVRVVGPVEE